MIESHHQRQASWNRRLRATGTIATLLICAVTLLFSQFTFVLDVRVDGERVGTVPDTQVLEEVIDTAEEAVVDLLGEPYDVGERVSYALRLSSISEAEQLDPQEVELGIFSHIDGVDMHYVVSVGGDPVGHVPDTEVLQEAKEDRIAALMDEGALSVGFLCEVTYEHQLVDLENTPAVEDVTALVESLSVETMAHVITTEAVPYERELVLDDRRFNDSVELLQEGMDGELEVLMLVTYIDGAVTDTVILQLNVLVEPVPEIIIEGTMERPRTASFGYYIWPAEGTFSSGFGMRRGRMHSGIDIAAPAGTAVWAADGGEVVFVGWQGSYGNLIQILHDNGHITYYAHLSRMDVSEGQRVYRGQLIGGVGTTGRSTGNHLHFEIRINGVAVNPLLHLP
ncbi:MAG: peptidoglycan DD-metalloendopeptidase family protein [Oscillospiraceae bacterium]|nr:peptidoglycan DD-metalloendopeptidase family protein [Oscillospiraceae bacterium]